MLEGEQILQVGQFTLEHIGNTRLGHLSLEHVLIAGVTEEFQIARGVVVEVILQRHVVEQSVGDMLGLGCIGAVFTTHHNLEAVIKEGLGQAVTVAGLGATSASALILVDAKREVDARQGLGRPCVKFRLQEREQCRAGSQVIDIASTVGARVGVVEQQVDGRL